MLQFQSLFKDLLDYTFFFIICYILVEFDLEFSNMTILGDALPVSGYKMQ